jgi:Fe2+ transport system protein FeoA/Mn-dependent DtxR family transcriptional regulator
MHISKSDLAYQRVEMGHALKAAYALQSEGRTWRSVELARALGFPDALASNIAMALIATGWAEENKTGILRLTETGEARAVELIRAHHLWERYLVDRKEMSLETVHNEADQREHVTSTDDLEELDAELGFPAWDPHGHAIPASGSQVPTPAGQSLLELAVPGSTLRVVRLDDEHAAVLSKLLSLGLEPGIELQVVVLESDLMRLRIGDAIIPLQFNEAEHVYTVPVPALPVRMGELEVGSHAKVVELTGSGKLQRRMLSMEFVPGAEITVVRESPLGDPLQYRVKKSNIALRRDEANTLLVQQLQKE